MVRRLGKKKRIYFSSQEEYNAYIKDKKEKAERKAQKELEYERQKYSVSVTVNSKYWKETGRLLIIKDGVQTKLANLPNGNTVKVKVHPTDFTACTINITRGFNFLFF